MTAGGISILVNITTNRDSERASQIGPLVFKISHINPAKTAKVNHPWRRRWNFWTARPCAAIYPEESAD